LVSDTGRGHRYSKVVEEAGEDWLEFIRKQGLERALDVDLSSSSLTVLLNKIPAELAL